MDTENLTTIDLDTEKGETNTIILKVIYAVGLGEEDLVECELALY